MYCKIFTATIMVIAVLTTGCSSVDKFVYHPDIFQGNYLMSYDIEKIHKGMAQQQVVDILGTPMLHDPFAAHKWFYVFRHQGSNETVAQQNLILTFDADGLLVDIET